MRTTIELQIQILIGLIVIFLIGCVKEDPATLATISTSTITEITTTGAKCGGSISNSGGASITARGVCWNTTGNPTTEDSFIPSGSGTGDFICSLLNLEPGTTYFVRAYATNTVGTAYGEGRQFTTVVALPTVTTSSITNITSSTANGGGNVTNDGGSSITARGVCWGTSTNPTITGSHTTNGTGIGAFTSSITELQPGITYFVRAYATNSAGTGYGTQVQLTTSTTGPTVTTADITDITPTAALGGGNVTSSGGATVTERGVCWGINENPTIDVPSYVVCGSGTGSFSGNITGLEPGTLYYVRAYARNSAGISYGDQKQFTTSTTPPTVSTDEITSITGTTAMVGGNVTSSGGTAVSGRGVIYSTETPPASYNGTVINSGSGTGAFTFELTGLQPNTTYYARAFATNSAGTGLGDVKSFTTNAVVPTLTTKNIGSITSSSATSGGTISSNGGFDITEKGVCWATTQSPTISSNHTSDGAGSETFNSNITGLQPGTVYYVRAYATNSVGTAYGDQKQFQTNAVLATVSTASISNILAYSATGGGTITNNGGGSITARGICYNTVGNPTISNINISAGTGSGSFSVNMGALTPSTTYYVRAYATNSAGTSYGNQVTFATPPVDGTTGTVNDINMNSYSTVYIGGKEWMTQNLRTTKFRNGDDIQNITDALAWSSTIAGAYAWYDNDVNNHMSGALYNFYAVDAGRGLCPAGWHIPTDDEWKYLEGFVDTEFGVGDPEWNKDGFRGTDAGKRLRAITGWVASIWEGTDDYGFNALPTGYRNAENANFYGEGEYLTYWSSSHDYVTDYGWRRYISNSSHRVSRESYNKNSGFAVRCVKD